MMELTGESFLPDDVLEDAAALLRMLQDTRSAAMATKSGIACEDYVRDSVASGKISAADAKRLYAVFDAALEIKIRSFIND
ncbi:hypothetical protein ACI2KS_24030 [Pseudomonas sp. NPDC087358]|uniref:hypothetical protein n=1 Tax=Pseudomonas sp. NPDC087358 TaxID=3364439 RepID=UPI0038507DD1